MTQSTFSDSLPATTPSRSGVGGRLVRPALTLWQREMVRFIRQRNRVVSALLTPLVFWLLLGSGLDRSFRLISAESGGIGTRTVSEGPAAPIGYLEYFFPGTIVMILLFTAIFSTISVIEDRREGFMQGVLAAPIPRMAIVLGKVLGGATLATIQGALVMALWPIVGGFHGVGAMVISVLWMFVVAVGLTAMGLCLAWPMDSTTGFHAVMNLVLMPMWFLCGAVFPPSAAPKWLAAVMYVNPLTYGQAVLRSAMGGTRTACIISVPLPVAVAIMSVFSAAALVAATWVVSRPRRDGR